MVYALNSDVVIDDVHVTKVDEHDGPDASGDQRNHAIVATSQPSAGAHTVEVENSLSTCSRRTAFSSSARR